LGVLCGDWPHYRGSSCFSSVLLYTYEAAIIYILRGNSSMAASQNR
jgi:hypothetical protein